MSKYLNHLILLIIIINIFYIIYLNYNHSQIDLFLTKRTNIKKTFYKKNKSNNAEGEEDDNFTFMEEVIEETIGNDIDGDGDIDDTITHHHTHNDDDHDSETNELGHCCSKLDPGMDASHRGGSTNLDDHTRVDYDDPKTDYNYSFHHNHKEYYCNNYHKHKLLHPKTPDSMKIKTDNGVLVYKFKPNDICCTKGDPKDNFKKKHVKCCNFSNVVYESPKTCYNSNLQ